MLRSEAFDRLVTFTRNDIADQWQNSPFGGSEMRESLWHRLKALEDLVTNMEALVTEARLQAEAVEEDA